MKMIKLAPNNRFNVSSRQEEIDMITKSYVPMNTQRSTAWSMYVTAWCMYVILYKPFALMKTLL